MSADVAVLDESPTPGLGPTTIGEEPMNTPAARGAGQGSEMRIDAIDIYWATAARAAVRR